LLTEAAQIIASIAYSECRLLLLASSRILCKGSPEALHALLSADAPKVLLKTLSKCQQREGSQLRLALVRSLKNLAVTCAEVIGPPLWGLTMDERLELKTEARNALDNLFEVTLSHHRRVLRI